MANDDKVLVAVDTFATQKILPAMHEHPLRRNGVIIGSVHAEPVSLVLLQNRLGVERIAGVPVGEQLLCIS
jgi:hydrogenase maturation factor